ncbi:hypothetical protein [Gulosibacter sp. 10]|uniref:MinD/ParA family ATP-binding protein n=1 Tax=Gulosibacter sp. 10 TaxID=1255570 RepID=UPI00097ED5F1|nr:hypothetical protein [Gulosibacter sp. 10]SJM71456.1 similar to ATPase involved in chromosome partitioning [Gulosibacter sp. 10]
MSQESSYGNSESGRELIALVRADGQGELRDGERVTRMRAADADELRGMLMERAMAIAVDEGVELPLQTIDVDGIYPLRCFPNGDLQQVGEVMPLVPGVTELTPEEDETARAADGGYAQLFGSRPDDEEVDEDSLHETIQLPRPAMMAQSLEIEERRIEERRIEERRAEERRAEAERVQEDEDLEEEIHEEGLDHDFDEAEEEGEAAGFAEPEAEPTDPVARPGWAQPRPAIPAEDRDDARRDAPAGRLPAEEPEPEAEATPEEEWQPTFARRPRQEPEERAPLGEDDDEDLLAGHETPKRRPRPERVSTEGVPTLDDFLSAKSKAQKRPAEQGWRAGIRRASGGLIKLGPGKRERTIRDEMASIQKVFDGTRTIVVMNPKGGAHKTTATLMIAAAFGSLRGGYTLAWDNNETRGTLGWRSRPGTTANTAVDLLRELPRFEISGGATISDIDRYVRNQGDAKFDVLASDDDAASAAIIDDDAFSRLHRVLSRFYRIMVIDTGNNMRASNWEAALDVADQLVIVSTAREDTAASAAWLADGLRERGYGDKLASAVTVLSSPSSKEDPELTKKLHSHFHQLTRAVVSVPYDQEFVGGGELNIPNLRPETREAWRHAAATIARGL